MWLLSLTFRGTTHAQFHMKVDLSRLFTNKWSSELCKSSRESKESWHVTLYPVSVSLFIFLCVFFPYCIFSFGQPGNGQWDGWWNESHPIKNHTLRLAEDLQWQMELPRLWEMELSQIPPSCSKTAFCPSDHTHHGIIILHPEIVNIYYLA